MSTTTPHLDRIVLGTLVLLVGCAGRPDASGYTRGGTDVTERDLAGRWRLAGGVESILDLEPDGTLYIDDFQLGVSPDAAGAPRPAMGTWKLVKGYQGWWTLDMHIECCDAGGSGSLYVANLRGNPLPDGIEFPLGEPGEGQAAYYVKTEPMP